MIKTLTWKNLILAHFKSPQLFSFNYYFKPNECHTCLESINKKFTIFNKRITVKDIDKNDNHKQFIVFHLTNSIILNLSSSMHFL